MIQFYNKFMAFVWCLCLMPASLISSDDETNESAQPFINQKRPLDSVLEPFNQGENSDSEQTVCVENQKTKPKPAKRQRVIIKKEKKDDFHKIRQQQDKEYAASLKKEQESKVIECSNLISDDEEENTQLKNRASTNEELRQKRAGFLSKFSSKSASQNQSSLPNDE